MTEKEFINHFESNFQSKFEKIKKGLPQHKRHIDITEEIQSLKEAWDVSLQEVAIQNEINIKEMVQIKGTSQLGNIEYGLFLKMLTLKIYERYSTELFKKIQKMNN